MDNFKIIVDNNSLIYGNNKQITGKIYVKINNNVFPEIEWNDFPIIILNWWCSSINIQKDEFHLKFMDGPFYIKVKKMNQEIIKIEFFKRGKKEVCFFAGQIKIQSLLSSLIDSVTSVIQFCNQKNWDSNELVELKNSYKNIINNPKPSR